MASKRFSASVVIGGAITGSLRSAFSTASKSLTQLGSETRRLATEQKTLSKGIDTFGRMGKNVDGLRAKYVSVTAQLEKMRTATERLARVERAREANMAKRAELRGQMLDTVALGMMAAAPVKAAVEFESAMADVKKVVDFAEPDGLKKMSRTIVEMSTRLPMAAQDIAAIVAAGGQSGLDESELTLFAESAVKMGVAFGITAEDAGQMMAEMRAAFKMSQEEVNTLADKMNLLANTTAASESKIASVVSRVGPLGEVAGLAAGEVAALGATLVGIGVDESIAATGIQNFMLALVQGEAATKAQRTAMAALGMDANQLAKGMQEDAQGTIMAVLEAVKKLPDERQASILTQLFGKESIKAIAPLLNVTDQLADNLAKVNDETRYSGAVAAEYAARAATTENNLQLLRNRVAGLAISLGNVLLPAVNSIVGAIGPLFTKLSDLAEAYPRVTKVVIGAAVGLVGLRVAALGGAYAFTFIKGAVISTWGVFAKLQAGLTLATAKFGGLGGIVRQVGFTLMRTPWGLAIAGLVAAGVLVYREWERIKAFFAGLWTGITQGLAPVREKFDGWIASMPGVQKAFELVGGAVSTVIDWFGKLFTPVNHTSEQLEAAGKAGQTMGQWIATGIEWALKPMMLLIESIQWVSKNIGGVIAGVQGMAEAGKQKITGAWESTKSFLGFGGSDDEAAEANSAPPGAPAVPAVPAATSRSNNNFNDNSQNTYTIVTDPSMSDLEFRRKIIKEIEAANKERMRRNMADGGLVQ